MNASKVPLATAEQIAQQVIARYGISRQEIRGTHLADLYTTLATVFPQPDGATIDAALRGEPEQETSVEPTWGVILETREHPALAPVIKNIIDNTGLPVQLFHGRENRDFILASPLAPLIDAGRVVLTPLNLPGSIGQGLYNQLLLAPRFWHKIKGRHKLLFFQTDALCCPAPDCALDAFIEFDYIGSRWQRERPVGLRIDGGSGGFSLRDWQMSVTCLERFPPGAWRSGEDGYFAFHLALMGASVAPLEEAAKFSTQDYFEHRSFGAHQIERLKDDELAAFTHYCPEALKIFPQLEQRLPRPHQTLQCGQQPLQTHSTAQTDKETATPSMARAPMFISHKHQFMYYEVPRTGSHSITRALTTLDPDSPTLSARSERGYVDYHWFTAEAKKHPDYRLFATHRNPYDRLWSFWKHRKQHGNPDYLRSVSWVRYINWVCDPESEPEIKGAMADLPITQMIDPERVNYWLDFHALAGSWQSLCGELGVDHVPLQRINASPDHGDMHAAFNEDMAVRVAERFRGDFDFFGYNPDSWQRGAKVAASTS